MRGQGYDSSGRKPKPARVQISQRDPLKPVPGYVTRCRVPCQPDAGRLEEGFLPGPQPCPLAMPLGCRRRGQATAFRRSQDKGVEARECRPSGLFHVDPHPAKAATVNRPILNPSGNGAGHNNPPIPAAQAEKRSRSTILNRVAWPAVIPVSSTATGAFVVRHQSRRRNTCQFRSEQPQGQSPGQEG